MYLMPRSVSGWRVALACKRRRTPVLATRKSLVGVGRVHGVPVGSGGTERCEYRTAVDAAEVGRRWVCRSEARGPVEARVRDARRTYGRSAQHLSAVLDGGRPVLSSTHRNVPEGVVVTHLHHLRTFDPLRFDPLDRLATVRLSGNDPAAGRGALVAWSNASSSASGTDHVRPELSAGHSHACHL